MTKVQAGLYLEADLLAVLKAAAEKEGRSFNNYIERALFAHAQTNLNYKQEPTNEES